MGGYTGLTNTQKTECSPRDAEWCLLILPVVCARVCECGEGRLMLE